MKLNEIISSGILEAQYLGLNSREDQKKVVELADSDAELSDYLAHLEETIENHFQTLAVPPPPEIRKQILLRTSRSQIQKASKQKNGKKTGKHSPEYLDIEVNDTYIKVHKYWRPAFIAVFALSKIFLILGLYYYFKSSNLEKQLEQLQPTVKTADR